jgi:hypothetical protein
MLRWILTSRFEITGLTAHAFFREMKKSVLSINSSNTYKYSQ